MCACRLPGKRGTGTLPVPIGRPVLYCTVRTALSLMLSHVVRNLEKGAVESTPKVPTSHCHTKHRTDWRCTRSRRSGVGGLTHTPGCSTPARIFKDPARNLEKGSVESTHKVPTSHYHTKHRNETRTRARDRERPGSPRGSPRPKLTTQLFFCILEFAKRTNDVLHAVHGP